MKVRGLDGLPLRRESLRVELSDRPLEGVRHREIVEAGWEGAGHGGILKGFAEGEEIGSCRMRSEFGLRPHPTSLRSATIVPRERDRRGSVNFISVGVALTCQRPARICRTIGSERLPVG